MKKGAERPLFFVDLHSTKKTPYRRLAPAAFRYSSALWRKVSANSPFPILRYTMPRFL